MMPAFARPYIPVYALTLLLSAFLLFLIQPMFGKMVLPLLGGSPSVWNTAMLFFQTMLLAGYAYAHGISRVLSVRAQALLHLALLALFIFVLPVAIPEGWSLPVDKNPALWQLSLMAAVVGGPFFVLSGSAPLLQHWFAHTRHPDAHNPYFLYAASNLGSLAALIAYPFLVEPAMNVSTQAFSWAWGYGLLIFFIALAALLAWPSAKATPTYKSSNQNDDEIITWQRRGLWLVLAFVPSSLMLGVTTFITTDIASVPLLWVIPLALYVGTFIIAFARRPIPPRLWTLKIHAVFLIILLIMQVMLISFDKAFLIALHLLVFFFTALMCHQELAASRPKASHLTQFYLIMASGGALGGLFNAIIAPGIFTITMEYGLVLAFSGFMRFASEPDTSLRKSLGVLKQKWKDGFLAFFFFSGTPFLIVIAILSYADFSFAQSSRFALIAIAITCVITLTFLISRRWVLGLGALIILTIHPPGYSFDKMILGNLLYQDRNFFGVIRVGDAAREDARLLIHGSTIHGSQANTHKNKLIPLTYFSKHSPVADAFALADLMPTPQKIGVLGLGIGTVSCYSKTDRSFDFFEIDPSVIAVATNPRFFTYLSDCGSPYTIITGDGRLKIHEQPDNFYDVIILDVFSSDNIPVHIITTEALAGYKQKLKESGFIVLHISNRYLDLRPVAAAIGDAVGMQALAKRTRSGKIESSNLRYDAAEYIIFTNNSGHITFLTDRGWSPPEKDRSIKAWTDSYSDIVSTLRFLR